MANMIPIPGSEKPRKGQVAKFLAHADERVEVTAWLRPAVKSITPLPGDPTPDDVGAVLAYAESVGMDVVEDDRQRRRMVLGGRSEVMNRAFGVSLRYYENPYQTFRSHDGPVSVPSDVAPVIQAVLGLDTRQQARNYIARASGQGFASPSVGGGIAPVDLAKAYNFPTGVTGKGQTVAIVELGGGYRPSDLATYFQKFGLSVPSVRAVGVDGGRNQPGSDADTEVALDIQVVGAVAPGCNIIVVFAPNTDRGFLDAVAWGIHNADWVSISWGAPEADWTGQAMRQMDAVIMAGEMQGVVTTVAAGDNGSSDGIGDGKSHADFPCSSPFSLACGGTRRNQDGSEVVWNNGAGGGATGGGFSTTFQRPPWQAAIGGSGGRGVPDVAGNADPQTGYPTCVNGQWGIVGGTSAVSPLMAGLLALIGEKVGKKLTNFHQRLYSAASAFVDITQGNNGSYQAGAGWDACTGLGVPDGAKLLSALSDGGLPTLPPLPPPPIQPPTGAPGVPAGILIVDKDNKVIQSYKLAQ